MAPGLTAEDRKRIGLFASVPPHRRRPELLCPDPDGRSGSERAERPGADEE